MIEDATLVVEPPRPRIYFSDFFGVDPEIIEEYGAFNVSLINDLPLFVDPFLLFDSEKPEYVALHDLVVRYVRFLRDRSVDLTMSEGQFTQWFFFPEVCENWLGFSKKGNRGSGLGRDFALALKRNLQSIFSDFGTETISKGSHLEKLCLVSHGVGRDHLSDFVTNIIKLYLIEYTRDFAREHVDPARLRGFAVDKVNFDFATARWRRGTFELPAYGSGFVLLTPKDMLTKDEAWINRSDLLTNFPEIYSSIPNEQLRSQINDYFRSVLSAEATEQERRDAASLTVDQFPRVLDYYVKQKEDDGEEAHRRSALRVKDTELQFIIQINELVSQHLSGTEFYELGESYAEALRRVHFLKHVIEDNDGYRLFYIKGKPVQREADLQIMYRLTWYATSYDVNREVNNGRGPVDYKISRGCQNSSLVEFKLASNKKLKQNLQNQTKVYEAASETKLTIKVIMHFSDAELQKVLGILNELKLTGREDIVLIDADNSNKPSGSNA